MTSSKNIVVILVVVVLVALILAIFIFFGGGKSTIQSNLSVNNGPVQNGGESSVLTQEFLSSLSSLKDLTIDSSFFEDKVFKSLVDYSKDLPDEPSGRENPFLPIGAGD